MEIIQIIITVFALFALSRAVLRFKDNKLTKNELVFWMLIWIAVIIIPMIPNLTSRVSEMFGIGRGMDLVMYLSIVALFYLMFRLYVKVESVQKEITSVVRSIAIEGKGKKKK
ncbi:DUF2304 family protein [Candidatus Woesearchaeota archaeon]|nr:DUF2304 family protein [Candidatus Woesearchaeota archaeon]